MNDLVRLHNAVQEKWKTASYSEQIQTLTLVPGKWSRMYCLEYFNVFCISCLNFTWNQKSSWNISKTCSLKRKNYHHLIWQQTFMKITISVARCLKRKTILVWIREYINKNLATCKSLCNLQELYTAFKEKHPNVNIGFSKFCA